MGIIVYSLLLVMQDGVGFKGSGCGSPSSQDSVFADRATTHRLLSSSVWCSTFRILQGNPKTGTTMEPMGLWVACLHGVD